MIKQLKIESEAMVKVLKFVKNLTKTMVFDENMESANWPKARRRNNFMYSLIPKQKGAKYKKLNLDGVKVLRTTYGTPKDDTIILYLHGGGFVTGSAFTSKSYSSALARFSSYKVYAPEYALAPENKYPAGFNDCCKAFECLSKQYPNAKFVFIGESAGGNYCLGLAHKYKATGKISCVITHSPTTDLSGMVDHSINENKDIIVKRGCSKPLKRMYIGDGNPKEVYASPILGDFTDFPPIFITCDINETLYADSKALYDKCLEAGVEVSMIEIEGGYHACAISATSTPETTQILKENISFMKKHA